MLEVVLATPEYKTALYQKVEYVNRDGRVTELKGATIFDPLPTTEYEKTNPHQHEALRILLGRDYVEKLAETLVVIPFPRLGWGHMFQAFAMGAELSRMGIKTIVVDIEELATTEEKEPLRLKQAWLKALHVGGGVGEQMEHVFQQVNQSLHLNIFQKTVMESLFKIANSYLEEFEPHFKTSLFHRFHNQLSKHRAIFNKALQAGVAIDSELYDRHLKDGFVHFLDQIKADYVVATHAAPVRALKKTVYEGRSSVIAPDPGYGLDGPELMQAMVTDSNKTIYAIPQEELVERNLRPYGVSSERIVQTGTIGFTPETVTLSEKWKSLLRQVLLSTSGNASNMEYLAQAVYDSELELYKANTPYRLFIFLGEHDDKTVWPVLNALQEVQDRNGGKPIPNLSIVRTENIVETAFWKWFLKWNCQVEIGKPGEGPLDAPTSGTVFIGLPAAAQNEKGNMLWAVRRKTALPSAWPPKVHEYWVRSKFTEKDDLLQPQINLFQYLDTLYERQIDQYAKRCLASVQDGFSPQFFVGALTIWQMLSDADSSLLGKRAKENKERLQQFIFAYTPKSN